LGGENWADDEKFGRTRTTTKERRDKTSHGKKKTIAQAQSRKGPNEDTRRQNEKRRIPDLHRHERIIATRSKSLGHAAAGSHIVPQPITKAQTKGKGGRRRDGPQTAVPDPAARKKTTPPTLRRNKTTYPVLRAASGM